MKTDNNKAITTDLPALIAKVKRQDKNFRIVYMVGIVLYAVIIAAHLAVITISIYKNIPITDWIKMISTLIPFLIIFYYLYKKHKEYKHADYSLSTYIVLKNMKKRYEAFRLNDLWVVVALIILGISMGIDSPENFLSFQLEYWSMLIGAMLVGYIYWYIKQKPLRDKASELIKELEE